MQIPTIFRQQQPTKQWKPDNVGPNLWETNGGHPVLTEEKEEEEEEERMTTK